VTYVTTSAPAAGLKADRARRTISGTVVPWGVFAQVSTGQVVAFARGSLTLSERAKLVLDHDPARPVAVYVDATDTEAGLEATFRVPAGPRGDDVLAEAAEGLRDGFSVGADLGAFDEKDGGALWVTAARGRHVALLSEPAFDNARVSAVVASKPPNGAPMSMTVATYTPSPEPEPEPEPAEPAEPAVQLTAAGAARPVAVAAPARVRDPYPYAQPLELGGPSFVRDAWAAMENPGGDEGNRWRRAQAMAADPAYVRAGLARFGRTLASPPDADLMAATGTSTTDPALVPPRWLPGRYVPLRGAKAPLYTALAKYGTPDFATLEVPRTATETGLAGVPADEVTPIAPGSITTTNDTVTINEVEGAYMFSRKLLMGSNPQIDRIALDAMDRAWLAEVESEAVTYFVGGANVHTAVAVTYADGPAYIATLRAQFAALAAATLYMATDVIPASKEYIAAAEADDSTGRALLPYGPQVNSSGESSAGFSSVGVQGVPLWPGPYMSANHTLILDQSLDAAVIFATPVMNFRLEWTSDATTGGNVKVLKLVKYSGVGFWAQYPGGIVLLTNSTPIAAAAGNGDTGTARAARK
jgi:phage head maturation protease